MDVREAVESVKAVGRGTLDGLKEFWDDYGVVVIGFASAIGALAIHEHGFNDGYARGSRYGFTSGWDECDKVTTKTLQDNDPELATAARKIMREHTAETIDNLYPHAFDKK